MDDEIAVDFSEPRFPLSLQEQREQWEWEWKHGLSSKKDWFRENNPDSDSEVIDEMITRIDDEGTPNVGNEQQPQFQLKNALI